jgi:hypothetical protein
LTDHADHPSARRWLEFVLEAQGKFEEAYGIHVQKEAGHFTANLN